ncbi:hypothetical protein B0H10DRAFT_2213978 [Mycena sp. CBHHK59/15]|nr:hypothetical protein B0H10DRAFT_2213978 [Mycena sp. CBHHK59/15]
MDKVRCILAHFHSNMGDPDLLLITLDESVNTEDWYIKAGIPHHRGYLGCQAPLTASMLNLNSLASASMDDTFPKHAIFLIEDIICVFTQNVTPITLTNS